MLDLGTLTSVTRDNSRANIEAWFPPAYSEYPPKKLQQRQHACKEFIFGPLRTEDVQERNADPIKQVPRMPYLEVLVDALIREHNLIIPKVRRMIQTLTIEGYELWRVLERKSTKVALVQASGADGEKHVEEDIKLTMFYSLPADIKDQFKIAEGYGQFKVEEKRESRVSGKATWKPWRSQILATPINSRELIGWGASSIFMDEFCSHPGARKACKMIIPTLFGRTLDKGQMIRQGTVDPDTASGRYFMELYERHNLKRARMAAKYGIEFTDGEA